MVGTTLTDFPVLFVPFVSLSWSCMDLMTLLKSWLGLRPVCLYMCVCARVSDPSLNDQHFWNDQHSWWPISVLPWDLYSESFSLTLCHKSWWGNIPFWSGHLQLDLPGIFHHTIIDLLGPNFDRGRGTEHLLHFQSGSVRAASLSSTIASSCLRDLAIGPLCPFLFPV